MENLTTLKIKYSTDSMNIIEDYIHRYNNLLRCTYNFMFDKNPTKKEISDFQKSLNNITTECGFKTAVKYEARALIAKEKQTFSSVNKLRKSKKLKQRRHLRKCLFGGKLLYNRYQKGLIIKEEFDRQRNFPLYVVGESNLKGNRHFEIKDLNTILFKPNRKTHVNLKITLSKKWKKYFEKLIHLQENKAIPITYKLDYDYIYVTFDLNKIEKQPKYKPKSNRVFAIDMNPNYIGYSIVDWKDEFKYTIIDSGVVSSELINQLDNSLKGKHLSTESKERKYITNKRNFEVCEIAKWLVNQAKHYKCEIFAFEDLHFKPEKSDRSNKFNRLCRNQWNYAKLTQLLIKRCNLENIFFKEVQPQYSSFFGNLIYRNSKLPDMCLASIEISRRAYELYNQYTKKTKEIKRNIIFPEVDAIKPQIEQALEEIGYIGSVDEPKKLYNRIKNMKLKYRVPLTSLEGMVFSMLSTKSMLKLYKFKQMSI